MTEKQVPDDGGAVTKVTVYKISNGSLYEQRGDAHQAEFKCRLNDGLARLLFSGDRDYSQLESEEQAIIDVISRNHVAISILMRAIHDQLEEEMAALDKPRRR